MKAVKLIALAGACWLIGIGLAALYHSITGQLRIGPPITVRHILNECPRDSTIIDNIKKPRRIVL
jgi:hypothetical protein